MSTLYKSACKEIRVETTEGGGSEFVIQFPIV